MEPAWQEGVDAPRYQRHRPEATLLYQLVERYYAGVLDSLAARVPKPPRAPDPMPRRVIALRLISTHY